MRKKNRLTSVGSQGLSPKFTTAEINALMLALNAFYNQKVHEGKASDKSVSHAVSAGRKLQLLKKGVRK